MAAVVNIYIETNITGIKPADGSVITVLEFVASNGKKATKTIQNKVAHITGKQAVLDAVNTALKMLNRPCYITLYVSNQYVFETIRNKRLHQWIKNHWKNAKGNKVAYEQQWKEYMSLSSKHSVCIACSRHSYYEWMQAQITREEV